MSTWIFDFDGTLTNVDLGREFSNWMFKSGRVGLKGRLIRLSGAPFNVLLRRIDVGQRFLAWSYGLSDLERRSLFVEFLSEFDDQIVINDEVLNLLRSSSENLRILITGCHEELARTFLQRRGINEFDEIIGMRLRNTFLISIHPYARTKTKLSEKYEPYVGIGDSWADRYFLKRATSAVVVDSDLRLVELARQKGWKVI
jgi:phosphoserine phosphatase